MANKLTIKSDGFANTVRLHLYPTQVEFQDGFLLSSKHTFSYGEINCVLLSTENVLSFQVRDEVFAIPLKRGRTAHEQGMRVLLENVRRAHAPNPVPAPPPMPMPMR